MPFKGVEFHVVIEVSRGAGSSVDVIQHLCWFETALGLGPASSPGVISDRGVVTTVATAHLESWWVDVTACA